MSKQTDIRTVSDPPGNVPCYLREGNRCMNSASNGIARLGRSRAWGRYSNGILKFGQAQQVIGHRPVNLTNNTYPPLLCWCKSATSAPFLILRVGVMGMSATSSNLSGHFSLATS